MPIQIENGGAGLVIAQHVYEPISLAFQGVSVFYHPNTGNGTERREELVEETVLCRLGEIVHKYTPGLRVAGHAQ